MGPFKKKQKASSESDQGRGSSHLLSLFRHKKKTVKDPRSQDGNAVASESTAVVGPLLEVIESTEPIQSSAETSGLAVSTSLWDRAYDHLKETEPKTVDKYERILSAQLEDHDYDDEEVPTNAIAQNSTKSRREQMSKVAALGLQRMEENKLLVISEHLRKVAGFLNSAKSLIDEAVKASPEASMVWAGVSCALVLFTNPALAQEANDTGFTYVVSRMKYYTAIETMLVPEGMGSNEARIQVKESFESHVIDLYKSIISFQIQSTFRFFRGRLKSFLLDVVLSDDWKGKLESVKDAEALIEREAQQINMISSVKELSGIKDAAEKQLAILRGQLDVAEEHKDISSQHLQVSRELLQLKTKEFSDKEKECHAIFRQDDYEFYKSRVDDRFEGTCTWVLDHANYKSWKTAEYGPLLITADPGCGKSVLAKYLIDHELRPVSPVVCYYFFKDNDQNTAQQALCAIIHQLLAQNPSLIPHAMEQYKENGMKLVETVTPLWKIIESAVRDPEVGQMIFVWDALDECAQEDREVLVTMISDLFNSGKPGKLKILLTGRPYDQVTYGFKQLEEIFPNIQVHGEDESETIRQEINAVITARVAKFTRVKNLKDDTRDHLQEKLLSLDHRTYLWVYLVFEHLEKSTFRKTRKGIDEAIDKLPGSVYEAYERILSKSLKNTEARKAFLILLAAKRPLTIEEMQVAMNTNVEFTYFDDLDLEDNDDFQLRLREMCGLFISVHQGTVYFFHQTAREFLLSRHSNASEAQEPQTSSASFTMHEAEVKMAEACIGFLCFEDFKGEKDGFDKSGRRMIGREEVWISFHGYEVTPVYEDNPTPFIGYASSFWDRHVEEAGEVPNRVWDGYCNKLCNRESHYCRNFTDGHCHRDGKHRGQDIQIINSSYPDDFNKIIHDLRLTRLGYQAALGHLSSVQRSLEEGTDINETDGDNGGSALQASCIGERYGVFHYLLEKGANPNIGPYTAHRDAVVHENNSINWELRSEKNGRTVAETLIEHGYDTKWLLMGLEREPDAAIETILSVKHLNINLQDEMGKAFLHRYVEYCDASWKPAKLTPIIAYGADPNLQDHDGNTPLHTLVRENGYSVEAIEEILDFGGCPCVANKKGMTPFTFAYTEGHGFGIFLLYGLNLSSQQEERERLQEWEFSPNFQAALNYMCYLCCSDGKFELTEIEMTRVTAWFKALLDKALGNTFDATLLQRDESKLQPCSVCGHKHGRYELPVEKKAMAAASQEDLARRDSIISSSSISHSTLSQSASEL
ncbi:hypothetical protein F4819DRAFT_260972 [Hypoxylon fuscum]|nr:hypothetical protein F4819DRAFT_260972 [Hypoxylon fuscum]